MKAHENVSQRFNNPKTPYVFIVTIIAITATMFNVYITEDGLSRFLLVIDSLILVSLVIAFYKGKSVYTLTQIGVWLSLITISINTWLDGGIYSIKNNWLLVMMLIQYYIGSRKNGLLWFCVIIFAMVVHVYIPQVMPAPVANNLLHTAKATNSLVVTVASSLIIFMLLWYFQNQFNQALELSKHRQQQLLDKQKELEQTVRMREHFISIVSHELRTPMNAILGLNSLLLGQVKDKPQAEKILAYTRQSADHLMTVINDVLDYSQFVGGQLTARLETFNLRATAQAAFELFKPRVESSNLNYVCHIEDDVPIWVESDRHRLMQVLVNLLGNAIKFTHSGSVCLRVQAVDGGVKFSVQDTGIGIAADQQQKIFERFSQAQPDIQSQYGGSGLGLTISLRLVQMLHGRMGLDSQMGVGSTFWFWLPLSNQAAPHDAQVASNTTPSSPPTTLRFLLVDDHPVNRLLAKQVLQQHWPGCSVDECENGAKAIQALQTGTAYDLMLVDMVMPVMDGIEITQWVRDSNVAHVHQLPVLGLTANVNELDLARFQQAGLNGLLLKPFDLERLRSEVQRLVVHRSTSV